MSVHSASHCDVHKGIGQRRCAGIFRPRPFHSRKNLQQVSAEPGPSTSGSNNPQGIAINEDVLARLRAAEEEAALLKKQLADIQGDKVSTAADADVLESKSKRIDGGDLRRETLFTVETKRRNWLSEADVEFFTGGGIGEGGEQGRTAGGLSPEEQATVNRRLAIGIVLTAAAAAFSLVPTENLKPPPSKPLFFYLVPLYRVDALLDQCAPLIDEGRWGELQVILRQIQGSPNSARENLYDAAALLPTERQRSNAQQTGRQFLEYVTDMDYNTFFDALPGSKEPPPQQKAKFVEFSRSALKAAKGKLKEYLALMPQEDLEAAQQRAAFSF